MELQMRKQLFDETVRDLVEHIVEELINDPNGDLVYTSCKMTEKDVELTVWVPEAEVPKIFGNANGDLLAAIKKLVFKVANQHGFYVVLKVSGYEQ
jgi:predicted RNA-binding protein YlqC (UPF0109 family)